MKAAAVQAWIAAVAFSAIAHAQPPPDPSHFQLGVWTDDTRSSGCVEVSPGVEFTMHAWCWVPDELGLSYVTYRFEFPDNVALKGPPVLSREVADLIVTEFADGTREWNLIFTGCPSGWVKVFTQDCEALDEQPAVIDIVEDPCWMRDCTFVLNRVRVLGVVGVNDPECGEVSLRETTWGALKGLFR
jgi:hypothetical protein